MDYKETDEERDIQRLVDAVGEGLKSGRRVLKTRSEHNEMVRQGKSFSIGSGWCFGKHYPTGVLCSHCGTETKFSSDYRSLSCPPQKDTYCPKCHNADTIDV